MFGQRIVMAGICALLVGCAVQVAVNGGEVVTTQGVEKGAATKEMSTQRAATQSGALPERIFVELPKPGVAFAISVAGGVASVDGNDTVTLYPKLGKGTTDGAVVAKVGGVARWIEWKRVGDKGYFLVLCRGDNTLYMLDDRTLKVMGKVELAEKPCDVAAPLSKEIGFAYVAFMGESTSEGKGVARVDLEKMKVVGMLSGLDRELNTVWVSADGKTLYGARRGVSPSGVRVYRLSASDLTTTVVANQHEDGRYVPDATGEFVGSGQRLMSQDWRVVEENVGGYLVAYFRERPWVVGATSDGKSLLVYSTNSMKRLGEVLVKPEVKPVTDMRNTEARDAQARAYQEANRYGFSFYDSPRNRVFADDANEAVILCDGNTARVYPLGRMKLPKEPFLSAVIEGPRQVAVDQTVRLSIRPMDARTKVTLLEGPEGMKQEGNTLVWKPGVTAVGSAEAAIRLSAEGAERTQRVRVDVVRGGVRVPMDVNEMQVSRDGKKALLVSHGRSLDEMRYNGGNKSGMDCRLMMIDLEKMEVVSDRTMEVRVHGAIMEGEHVYAAARDADAFYVLSQKDLSEAKRIFTKGRVNKLATAGGRLYADGRVYSLPEMELQNPTSEGEGRNYYPYSGDISRMIPARVGDKWLMNGVLFDAKMSKATLALRPMDTLMVVGTATRDFGGMDNNRPPLAPWGMQAMGQQISRLSGQTVGQIEGQSAVEILESIPAAVVVSVKRDESEGRRDRPPSKVELVAHELVTGRRVGAVALSNSMLSPNEGNRDQTIHLKAAGGRVVVVFRGVVYAVPLTEFSKEKFAEPVHFAGDLDQMMLDGTKVSEITYKARGGKGALSYSFSADAPEFEIEKATGKVRINGPKLVEKAAIQAADSLGNRGYMPPSTQPREKVETPFEIFRRQMADRFKNLYRIEVEGIPVGVPVSVVARDSEQQMAVLTHYLFIDVPREKVEGVLKERQAKLEEQRRQYQESQRAQLQAQRGPTESKELADLKKQMSELEKEVLELRAQNKLLKELVGQRVPATLPSGN